MSPINPVTVCFYQVIQVPAHRGGTEVMTTIRMATVFLSVLGLTSVTWAGVFDLDGLTRLRLNRKKARTVAGPGDCEASAKGIPPSREREIKQPCTRSVHTYQRRKVKPLPPAAPDCNRPAVKRPGCKDGDSSAARERDTAREIAALIFRSQTACYARHRRAALHRLGDDYNCASNPEILVAFVFALNDADETVRAKAADEIGDQLKANPDCRVKEVIAALKVGLTDCDAAVRHESKLALKVCGYQVVATKSGDCARPAGRCIPSAPAAAQAPPARRSLVSQPSRSVPRGLPALKQRVREFHSKYNLPGLRSLLSSSK